MSFLCYPFFFFVFGEKQHLVTSAMLLSFLIVWRDEPGTRKIFPHFDQPWHNLSDLFSSTGGDHNTAERFHHRIKRTSEPRRAGSLTVALFTDRLPVRSKCRCHFCHFVFGFFFSLHLETNQNQLGQLDVFIPTTERDGMLTT